ncbi:MAG: Nif3-like dinuclear metal center hexameric protein [Rhodopirellula sp.]|nr:Nif3-like dinuclear metal center hexameric protein [Rhodopirellula sp.]
MLVRDVADMIESHAPRSAGVPGDQLGLLAGDPDAPLAGVVTCWSPTLQVLDLAADRGANLVISHEPLTWEVCGRDPEAGLEWYQERHPTAKAPNQRRLALIAARGLSVYRYHSNWDWAPRFGMVDMLARLMELGEQAAGPRVAPVYRIGPTTVGELLRRARSVLQTGPLRVVGDPARTVTRVAICHGGFGQMFTFPEVARDAGAELALFGEMLDYTIRYCVEIDLAAIELGHYRSEHPGMQGMADFLRQRIAQEIPVECLPSHEPWRLL